MAQSKPCADRIRPSDFDGVVGQQHLVGKNGVLRKMCEHGHITSMIFFCVRLLQNKTQQACRISVLMIFTV